MRRWPRAPRCRRRRARQDAGAHKRGGPTHGTDESGRGQRHPAQRPAGRSEWPQGGSREAQRGPRQAQRGPREAPERTSERSQTSPQRPSRGPREAPERPQTSPREDPGPAPERPPERPRQVEVGRMLARTGPSCVKFGPTSGMQSTELIQSGPATGQTLDPTRMSMGRVWSNTAPESAEFGPWRVGSNAWSLAMLKQGKWSRSKHAMRTRNGSCGCSTKSSRGWSPTHTPMRADRIRSAFAAKRRGPPQPTPHIRPAGVPNRGKLESGPGIRGSARRCDFLGRQARATKKAANRRCQDGTALEKPCRRHVGGLLDQLGFAKREDAAQRRSVDTDRRPLPWRDRAKSCAAVWVEQISCGTETDAPEQASILKRQEAANGRSTAAWLFPRMRPRLSSGLKVSVWVARRTVLGVGGHPPGRGQASRTNRLHR